MKLVVQGIPKNTSTWVELGRISKSNGGITEDTNLEEVNAFAEKLRKGIKMIFKEKLDAEITIGDTVINASEFVAISVFVAD